MDRKHTHLGIIQGVINRLSTNSFLLKGWSVVIVSALLALAAKDAKALFACIAFFPCLIFWGLDGYFLWQERLFRNLYNKVRTIDPQNIDYSMEHIEQDYTAKECIKAWVDACLSKTLIAFHGGVLGTIIIVILALK